MISCKPLTINSYHRYEQLPAKCNVTTSLSDISQRLGIKLPTFNDSSTLYVNINIRKDAPEGEERTLRDTTTTRAFLIVEQLLHRGFFPSYDRPIKKWRNKYERPRSGTF